VSPVWTNLISRSFGARSFGRAMGIMNPLHIPITAPSAPLAGYISDTTGSYTLVFVVYIALLCTAAIALAFVRQPIHKNKPAN
jgi:cyanate permease